MWILLFIFTGHTVLLEKYDTLEECQSEGKRVLMELQKVYPDDTSMKMSCYLPPGNDI